MAQAKLETPQETETVSTPVTAAYSAEAWEQLEAQRQKMLDARIEHHFALLTQCVDGVKTAEGEILKAVGTQEKAHERIVLLAAKGAGTDGMPLSELRRFIPDPNHLNKARETLLGAKDKNGKPMLPVLIEERRGENNEMRIFVLNPPDEGK